MAKLRSRTHRASLIVGATAMALTGGLITAPPASAASFIDLSVADLASAAAASGGAFSVTGPNSTDDLTISGDVDLKGAAGVGRVITVTGGTTGAPRLITLQSVSGYAGSDSAAIQLAAGAHAKFTLTGTSSLTGSSTRPGLGILVGAELTITAASTAGRLDVNGGSGNAAAIGGDGNAVLTDPTTTPATITGLSGAGCGSLAINGGTVNAKISSTSATGAAIGGGRFGAGCAVSISGGIVNASATAGAGIGGGIGEDAANGYGKDSPGGAGGAVQISGGTVTAASTGSTVVGETEPRHSADIGGGRGGKGGAETQGTDGAPGTLAITGGSVKFSLTSEVEGFAPKPMIGAVSLGQVLVPSAAGVSQVVVTPEGGSAIPFNVAANHPSDNALYLFLPHSKKYSIAVTTGATTTTYQATLLGSGGATAMIPAADPAKLAASGVSFDPLTVGYAAPAAKAVTVSNIGGTATTITSATVTPSGEFTVAKPATVSLPVGGSNSTITVVPVTGLAVGTHEAALTLSDGLGHSVSVPLSFTVRGVPALQLSTPMFAGGVVGAYTPVAQNLVITNTGSANADLTGVTSSNPGAFSVENSTASVAPGGSATVRVTPAAGLGVGTYTSTITATYAGQSATANVSFTVSPQPVTAIKAGQTTLTVVKGSTVAIPAYGYEASGKAVPVTWTSSNSAIATVSTTGAIKGIAAGKATIAAVAGGKSTSVRVTVLSKKSKTKVKSVSGNVPKTMKVGARAYVAGKYSPTTAPNAKVTYSSSSKSVVTVDAAGTLTAKKKGKVSITIKAGGKSKKYTVTVK